MKRRKTGDLMEAIEAARQQARAKGVRLTQKEIDEEIAAARRELRARRDRSGTTPRR